MINNYIYLFLMLTLNFRNMYEGSNNTNTKSIIMKT